MNKKALFSAGVIVILGFGFFLLSQGDRISSRLQFSSELAQAQMKVYKSSTCGCCGVYVDYLRRNGMRVSVVERDDVEEVKHGYGVPHELWSCHTTDLGDYVVEGHIPLEAIDKLMADRPEIAGIALPGMPSGSPGMPGAKLELFEIRSFTKAGSIESFVNL